MLDRVLTEDLMETDVTIIGSSISALMAASFLKQENPDTQITVIGPRPDEEKRPIVGESLIEPSTMLFHKLGLGKYLDREHFLKNTLAYYHKLRPEDAEDRRYSLHATDGLIYKARQLHRPRFDGDLRIHAESQGVRFLAGKAVSYDRTPTPNAARRQHDVCVKVADRQCTLRSRWVIDATGRNRWLGKQVTTYQRPTRMQRSTLWFRLAGFEPFLDKIDISQRRPFTYNIWEATHHFMGHGNWVWGIPLKSAEHAALISIGITYRPDLFPHPMRSMEDFLAYMDTEHPAVSEMVRSGTVIDTHVLHNLLYVADQVYSPDGWFLLGDAAQTVDPLYSTGMSMTVFQLDQINAVIQRQRRGTVRPGDIRALEAIWMSFARQRSHEIGRQYEIMHDPFQSAMRHYWVTHTYFEAVLPVWWNGMFFDPQAARLLRPLFELNSIATAAMHRLFAQVSSRVGPQISQADFDRTTDLLELVNPEFDCPSSEVPQRFADLFQKRIQFRRDLMRMAGRHRTLGQLPVMAMEHVLAKLVPFLLRRSGICVDKAPYIDQQRMRNEPEPIESDVSVPVMS